MKRYQEGGTTGYTQYAGNRYTQDDPMQYLLEQLGSLGYNFNPYDDIASQLQEVTPESLSQHVRSTYDIGPKIEMHEGMFQGFSPTELSSLRTDFYDPIFEEGRGTVLQNLVSNMGKIGGHGFAETGGDIRKKDLAQDIYKKGIEKTFVGIDETKSQQMQNILNKISGAHQTGVGLRYGNV
jgi:hypothetical protein